MDAVTGGGRRAGADVRSRRRETRSRAPMRLAGTTSPPGGTHRRSTASTNASLRRVKRDPADTAKLLLVPVQPARRRRRVGYLPLFAAPCPAGASEVRTAIRSNRNGQGRKRLPSRTPGRSGLSFYHNLFTREHNAIRRCSSARKAQPRARRRFRAAQPGATRRRRSPMVTITRRRALRSRAAHRGGGDRQDPYNRVDAAAALRRAAQRRHELQLVRALPRQFAAKPHHCDGCWIAQAARSRTTPRRRTSSTRRLPRRRDYRDRELQAEFQLPAAMADLDTWTFSERRDVNGGTNHFGSPFNFPEEFVSVYRLHALAAGHDRISRPCR